MEGFKWCKSCKTLVPEATFAKHYPRCQGPYEIGTQRFYTQNRKRLDWGLPQLSVEHPTDPKPVKIPQDTIAAMDAVAMDAATPWMLQFMHHLTCPQCGCRVMTALRDLLNAIQAK